MIEADADSAAAGGGSQDTISGYSYDEIEAAVLQTESGRAFLAEHARRVRLECELQLSGEFADLRARLAALYRKLDEMGAAAPAAPRAQSAPAPVPAPVSVPAVFVRPPAQTAAASAVPAPYFPPARFNVEPIAGTGRGIPAAAAEPEAVDWVPPDAAERPVPTRSRSPAAPAGPTERGANRAEASADWFMLQEDPILDTSGIAPPSTGDGETAPPPAPDETGSEPGVAATVDEAGLDRRADAQHTALTGMLRRMRRAMGEPASDGPAGQDRSASAG